MLCLIFMVTSSIHAQEEVTLPDTDLLEFLGEFEVSNQELLDIAFDETKDTRETVPQHVNRESHDE